MGRPHLQIIQYAETNQVDLTVMSTRGQSGRSHWLMRSVSDRVVRGANVPALLVRARKEETQRNQRGRPQPGNWITRPDVKEGLNSFASSGSWPTRWAEPGPGVAPI